MPQCVICLKNDADSRHIKWTCREGKICSSCNEKTWDCPECSRYFYVGDNLGYKPPHNVSPKKKSKPCHGWKNKNRLRYEKRMGWI